MVDNGILWINPYPVDNTIFIDFPNTQPVDIEDITWPRGDTKFFFECWKIFHEWMQWTSECSERVNAVNEWNIFFNMRREISYLQAAV